MELERKKRVDGDGTADADLICYYAHDVRIHVSSMYAMLNLVYTEVLPDNYLWQIV